MRCIGLIGGTSWESTVTYYQILNRTVKERLGGLHSARCLLHSVDFHEIEACMAAGRWDEVACRMREAAESLERGGAEAIVLCSNTMHKVADAVAAAVPLPLLHIADMTLAALRRDGVSRVGLLGTAYTMEQDFYTGRLQAGGVEALVPDKDGRAGINRIIFEELCRGSLRPESKRFLLAGIDALASRGAQGIILGCTELGLLVAPADTALRLYDTTVIHALGAVDFALA